MPKLGIIAGNRTFPIYVAQAAKAQGYDVVAVGLREETLASLEEVVDRMHWVSLSEIGQVPDLLKKEGVQELILAGQIQPHRLLQSDDRFEGLIRGLMAFLPDRSGASAMKLAVQVLEKEGFKVLDSSRFLKEWIPEEGLLTRRIPTPEEKTDYTYGLPLARELARLNVGQTLVVRKGAVVAVEGMEGTDAAIRRAGEIAGPGCVVVKACEAGHDMRFDIPAVGASTLAAMEEAKASCLAIEADRVLVFEKPQFVEEANQMGVSVVAV